MTEDKELIRRALLGDQQAQKECTEKEIVLPCPHCGSNKINKKYACGDYWYSCEHCKADSGMHGDYRISLSEWNTRPAPPIGKCGECKYSREPTKQDYEELDRYSLMHKDACVCTYDEPKEVWKFDFCSSFKPREE